MIYLMRHGQDDEQYLGGWSDVPLILKGKEEVKESALWMKENLHINEIISSDVKRAKETSYIVNSILEVPVTYDKNLREQNKGLLNGMLKSELLLSYPQYINNVTIDTVYPQGESLRNLYNRIKEYIGELMRLDDDTLIVTHRGVINMIYYILNNQELDMNKKQFNVETASVHELDKINKKIKRIR